MASCDISDIVSTLMEVISGSQNSWRNILLLSLTLNVALLSKIYYQKIFKMNNKSQKEMVRIESEETITLPSDSVINVDHGDPIMFESYWKRMGEKISITISGWHSMSYFSNVDNLCWFLEPEFAEEVIRLHNIVGNAETKGRHVVVGTGSTQLFQAALYAICSESSEPMHVVSAVPYYSSYPLLTNYLRSELYRWEGDAFTYNKESPYIELVTSPNNPDGTIREAVLTKPGGKIIHDLAYYWPQYTPITSTADHDLMLFTVSKSTGHAGTRIGWALVKDKEVAKKMTKFIELNTIGVSKDSQLRAARILQFISETSKQSKTTRVETFFDFARHMMAERWNRLRGAINQKGRFSVPEFESGFCNFFKQINEPHPAFAWIKCEAEEVEDCCDYLRKHKILNRSGKHFGSNSRYVRLSMLDRNQAFDLLIQRLTTL